MPLVAGAAFPLAKPANRQTGSCAGQLGQKLDDATLWSIRARSRSSSTIEQVL